MELEVNCSASTDTDDGWCRRLTVLFWYRRADGSVVTRAEWSRQDPIPLTKMVTYDYLAEWAKSEQVRDQRTDRALFFATQLVERPFKLSDVTTA